MGYFVSRDLYTTKSASEVTSEVHDVRNARTLWLQTVGSPSTTTVQFSNDGGTTYSTATTIIGARSSNFSVGQQYMRLQRSETTNAVVAGQWEAF